MQYKNYIYNRRKTNNLTQMRGDVFYFHFLYYFYSIILKWNRYQSAHNKKVDNFLFEQLQLKYNYGKYSDCQLKS